MRTPDRIVIVDNDPARSAEFRAALEARPEITLAAVVTCASCSFAAVSAQKPDLVVLHLNMPGHRVLQLAKDLLVLHSGLKLLIVSGTDEELEPGQVMRAGAHGCVPHSSSTAAKLDAVHEVLAGRPCFISPTSAPSSAPARQHSSVPPLHWVNATVAL
ncbi:MAG: response regulator transcription factor [Verrucomicrobia bacterium]|nr:response regulator transcription factor [Verrucomicrobiota bacterium]